MLFQYYVILFHAIQMRNNSILELFQCDAIPIQTFSKMVIFHFSFYSKSKGSLEVFQVDVASFQSCSDSNLKVQNHFQHDKFNIAEMALHLCTDITFSEIAFIIF